MRICITISEREKQDLKKCADTMGISMGAMVRVAISDYVHSNFYIKNRKRK